MKKKTTIAALLIALTGFLFGICFYFVSAERNKKASWEKPQEVIRDEQVERKNEKPETNEEVILENKLENNFGEKPTSKRAALENSLPADQQTPKANNLPQSGAVDAMLNSGIKRQVSRFYDDLFKELDLPEEQRKQVEEHLVKSTKSELEFDFKLLNPDVPVDELLRDQDRLSRELNKDLKGILSEREQELIMKHQKDYPKKMQKSQIMMLVDGLNLEGEEKETVQSAIELAVQNLEAKKSMGEYSAQDIVDYRKQFKGAKPGDPDFIRATIEASTQRNKTLLKGLEHLPKEHYEAIKKGMEAPLEMMQQVFKHQKKQD